MKPETVVRTPEIWEGGAWSELPGAGTLEIPYYPRNFVDPKNGLVFYASERVHVALVQRRWHWVSGGRGAGARSAHLGVQSGLRLRSHVRHR